MAGKIELDGKKLAWYLHCFNHIFFTTNFLNMNKIYNYLTTYSKDSKLDRLETAIGWAFAGGVFYVLFF